MPLGMVVRGDDVDLVVVVFDGRSSSFPCVRVELVLLGGGDRQECEADNQRNRYRMAQHIEPVVPTPSVLRWIDWMVAYRSRSRLPPGRCGCRPLRSRFATGPGDATGSVVRRPRASLQSLHAPVASPGPAASPMVRHRPARRAHRVPTATPPCRPGRCGPPNQAASIGTPNPWQREWPRPRETLQRIQCGAVAADRARRAGTGCGEEWRAASWEDRAPFRCRAAAGAGLDRSTDMNGTPSAPAAPAHPPPAGGPRDRACQRTRRCQHASAPFVRRFGVGGDAA